MNAVTDAAPGTKARARCDARPYPRQHGDATLSDAMTIRDRLRLLLTWSALMIGVTAYAATDDIALSLLISAAIGLSGLGGAVLLLFRMRGGAALATASAVALIATQLIATYSPGLGWMRLYYLTVAAVALTVAAAGAIAELLRPHPSVAQQRRNQAWR